MGQKPGLRGRDGGQKELRARGRHDEQRDAAQPQQTRQCQVLVDMALGGPVPALRDDNWLALRDWVLGRLAQTDGILPRS